MSTKILLKAIIIVEHSIELEKNYNNVDTHAALLYKTGNYTKALKRAKEAIYIAKSHEIDYTSTTNLIQKLLKKCKMKAEQIMSTILIEELLFSWW